INTKPKGAGQAIGASSATAPLRKLDFSPSLISPIYSTSGGREQLADFGFEIVAVDGVDLGCDLQRHPTALGYPDRLIDSLFRRNAAEKGKIGRRDGLWRQKPLRQAMVNGVDPPGAGNGPPLGVRNRDHRDRGK